MGAAKRFKRNPGNAAITYYRYSSDAQRDASIDQQAKAAHDYADTHGYHIIKEYEDRAISGTRDDRAGYNLMLYEVEKLRPAYLILWKTDRLSRDKIDAVLAKDRLRRCGVEIKYVAENIPDGDEEIAVLMESFFEGLAAAYIEGHKKNVKRGMDYNAENCLYNGVKLLGYYGEENQPYKIDPGKAPIAQKIFQDYADGVPMKKIMVELNSKGIKNAHGRDFTIGGLRALLTNRAYIGVYKWGNYETADGMPRLVSDELFEKVAARLESNRHTGKGAARLSDPESPDYWLTGKLYCGLCGGTMQGCSGVSKQGIRYYYYSCINHRKHTCKLKNLPKALLERIVVDVLEKLIQDPAHRLLIASACYAKYEERNRGSDIYEKDIQERLKDTESRISKLLELLETGKAPAVMMERLNVLDAEKTRLEKALLAEQNMRRFHISMDDIVRFLEAMDGDLDDPENRRQLLDQYVDRIVVTGETMAVSFYYTEGRREFDLRDKIRELDGLEEIREIMRNAVETAEVDQEILESLLGDNDDDDDPDDDPPGGGGPSGCSTSRRSGGKTRKGQLKQATEKPSGGSPSSQLGPPPKPLEPQGLRGFLFFLGTG